ncbi:HAD-IIB family hydrolase [Geminocystis sp. NIES-3709]|uniref:HAD-IIB family hydrolase n=1 Tax=Geminocystis sp. NIES-3709 TaxID=1617448 RepID=UPI0005FC9787|nr:HAD-IIB family hydrolase [Geminocystis sp. NIES-3709]BAQ64825.1 alpha,alpha-trehalose-phosphate synthase [UDP-forming] [Geminocystis sp. NIES-3709]
MMNKLLICTDLDRTLIPNGSVPESPQARSLFAEFVSQPHITLTYVTGRDKKLVQNAIEEYQLPLPNFVIADVGSTIYHIENSQWLRIEDWDNNIAIDWQGKNSSDLIPLFEDIKQCQLQEKEKQGLHKLSYYMSLDEDKEIILTKIKSRLENESLKSNLIWSIDEEEKTGLLDILPQSANKYYSIEYLMKSQNFTLENTIFSGDSGNDLDVLISPIKSILVGNASIEVKEKIKSYIETINLTDSIYIAKGEYLTMNGNYSAGILEGIAHYFPRVNY